MPETWLKVAFELQGWLYAGALAALGELRAANWHDLPGIVAGVFAFGMLHALLPGHGKAVLVSFYAGSGKVKAALASSALLIVTHVGSAILLVLTGYALLQRTLGAAGRAPALELASQMLVVAIGLFLLWRALRPHAHRASGSGPVLAMAAGLVPCPLTTFIMTYAASRDEIAVGLILSAAFAAGMIVTVAAFPIAAILFRTRLLRLIERTGAVRHRLGRALEVLSAGAIVLLGLVPVAGRSL
ncbi:sulfite exporter TauE/SafE family protein [Pseudoxanthobacter sp. M-2]|uniref:urease accessory protein UreH domain-containing protein n=1 Tax=Pseudoxanthobacter sp. M-2 TaxID=3078754 RepID=UPI0038FC550B